MSTAGFERTPPLQSGRAVGQVQSVNLDLQDCAVKIGPTVADGVTWYGDPPKVGDTVQMVQTANRLVITNAIVAPGTGGGTGGGGTVEQVVAGFGITVAGTPVAPVVSANRSEIDDWFADKDSTETAIATLGQKYDALVGQLIFAGTYNAATRRISSLSLAVAGFPEYAVDRNFTQIPAAAWNAKHYFIVDTEGVIPQNDADGIVEVTGSVATHYRVGDWIISNGRGAQRAITFDIDGNPFETELTIAPMMAPEPNAWLHLSYSSRLLLATSVVLDGTITGITGTTVQQALADLEASKAETTHGHDAAYSKLGHGHDYAPAVHGHAYAPEGHGHNYADPAHGHNPSGAGIRIGSYNFASIAPGAEETSPAIGKYGDELIILQRTHPSNWISVSLVNVGAGSFQIKARNSTTSTTHTNVGVWYFLVRNA